MIRNNSPECYKYTGKTASRRVASEVPDYFQSTSSVRKQDYRKSFLQVSYDISKYSNSTDLVLAKHREIILDLVKTSKQLTGEVLTKLRDITNFPDLLTDVIYKKIRGDIINFIQKPDHKEELAEIKKHNSNLQTQLIKAKQSNEELTNMLLSVEVQQKLHKDLNESISLITNHSSVKPQSQAKKRLTLTKRLDYDKILNVAQTGHDQEGLKNLCEEVRRGILADSIIILTPNAQKTYFSGILNGENISIQAKATVLCTVYHTAQSVSAKIGDTNFDPRIQQVFKTKVNAFSAGVLADHRGNKMGILLILRKRPDLLFERDFQNILNIFCLYIIRWKLAEKLTKQEKKFNQLLEAANDMLNSKILTDFLGKLNTRLPAIFDCERANILLFDYEKNTLFRKTSQGSYDNFPIFNGLSGICVNTKKPIICNEVLMERLFNKEMDDPLGDNTVSILSVPLFSKVYEDIPEAVLQVINKIDGTYFDANDQDTMTRLSKMVTNCMIVLKYTQMSANSIDFFKRLEENLDRMHQEMNSLQYDFGSVKASIVAFKGFLNKQFGN